MHRHLDLGDLDLQSYEISSAATRAHPRNDYVYPNGESFQQSLDRVVLCFNEINTKYRNQKILIVSHGFPCEALLDWVRNKPLQDWPECIEKGKVFSLKN